MTAALVVFAGGGAGSLVRYLLGVLFRSTTTSLPLATFAANICACIIFALFIYIERGRPLSSNIHLLVLTGFCGGLSTFSTFGYETWLLLAAQQWSFAALNMVVSMAASLALFYLATR